MVPSAAVLVARFLKTNGYTETLATFVKEAGLGLETVWISNDDLTIEQILQEKKAFDVSVDFEKLGIEDDKGWHNPAPSVPTVLNSLSSKSNVLSTSITTMLLSEGQRRPYLMASSADRRLSIIKPATSSNTEDFPLLYSYGHLQDSPILAWAILGDKYLLVSSMSGKIRLYNTSLEGFSLLEERSDHSKYVVKISTWQDDAITYVATAGWDAQVFVYAISRTHGCDPQLGIPVATLSLPSNPESVLFVEHPESPLPVLLVTRRDSTFFHYYELPTLGQSRSPTEERKQELHLLGKQNLAPHSTAWVAFTPTAVEISPVDSSVVAVATSTIPHMKLIIARLLLPPLSRFTTNHSTVAAGRHGMTSASLGTDDQSDIGLTQSSQARAALLLQNREEAAIMVQCSTLAPQTQYSTPSLCWRPDGSGVWVNSDDGVIRGVEANSGKLVISLKAHEPGSKIRCLWAGRIETHDKGRAQEEEWLISGGFDQRLVVWKVA